MINWLIVGMYPQVASLFWLLAVCVKIYENYMFTETVHQYLEVNLHSYDLLTLSYTLMAF